MKKVKIACALFLCLLCSCSIQNNDAVENNANSAFNDYNGGVIKYESESLTSMSTSINISSITETAETLEKSSNDTETGTDSNITLEELAVMRLDEMMNSFIQKDADTLQQYIYSYDGYLNNVDFTDYEILDFSVTEEHELYCCKTAVFNIEIGVSKSNNMCFQPGRSQWKIMLYGDNLNNCMYFLRDIYSDVRIYSENSENEAAQLGYVFSYSFNCFETVNDISKYCFNMNDVAFVDGIRAFVRIADEVTPQIINEYGDIYYSKEDVNTIISKYLGITDYSWDKNFIGLGGDRLWKVWDMTTVYAVITEQTDSYIDMVYFADYVYLTPAKKMRYYFTYINDSIQLTGTELIEDYGYEPNWNMY